MSVERRHTLDNKAFDFACFLRDRFWDEEVRVLFCVETEKKINYCLAAMQWGRRVSSIPRRFSLGSGAF